MRGTLIPRGLIGEEPKGDPRYRFFNATSEPSQQGTGEINRLRRSLPAKRVLRLLLELVRNRERDLVLLDAGVKDLVVEQ